MLRSQDTRVAARNIGRDLGPQHETLPPAPRPRGSPPQPAARRVPASSPALHCLQIQAPEEHPRGPVWGQRGCLSCREQWLLAREALFHPAETLRTVEEEVLPKTERARVTHAHATLVALFPHRPFLLLVPLLASPAGLHRQGPRQHGYWRPATPAPTLPPAPAPGPGAGAGVGLAQRVPAVLLPWRQDGPQCLKVPGQGGPPPRPLPQTDHSALIPETCCPSPARPHKGTKPCVLMLCFGRGLCGHLPVPGGPL